MGIAISQDEIDKAAFVLVVREDDGYLWGTNKSRSAAVQTLRRIAAEIEGIDVEAGVKQDDKPWMLRDV